jgi:hypothetical protein
MRYRQRGVRVVAVGRVAVRLMVAATSRLPLGSQLGHFRAGKFRTRALDTDVFVVDTVDFDARPPRFALGVILAVDDLAGLEQSGFAVVALSTAESLDRAETEGNNRNDESHSANGADHDDGCG